MNDRLRARAPANWFHACRSQVDADGQHALEELPAEVLEKFACPDSRRRESARVNPIFDAASPTHRMYLL